MGTLLRLVSLFVFVMVSMTLTACSGEKSSSGSPIKKIADENGQPDETLLPPDFKPGQCEISPLAGEKSILTNSNIDNVTRSNFFGKNYDLADVEAVFSASAVRTAEYALKALKINAYKVPKAKADQCSTHALLPDIPEDRAAEWGTVGTGSGGGGTVAGVYFEDCEKAGCKYDEVVQPTILVGEHTGRWTLVHEMLHHNFNSQRKAQTRANPGNPEMIPFAALRPLFNKKVKELDAAMDRYKQDPTQDDLLKVTQLAGELLDVTYRILIAGAVDDKSSSFEEIAVEGVLAEHFLAGRLKYVTMDDVSNAIWYMCYAREAALPYIDQQFEGLFAELETEAAAKFWPQVTDEALKHRQRITEIQNTTANHIRGLDSQLQTTPGYKRYECHLWPGEGLKRMDKKAVADGLKSVEKVASAPHHHGKPLIPDFKKIMDRLNTKVSSTLGE